MNKTYYIHNAVIVNEGRRFSGSLVVSEGKIAAIFQGRAPEDYLFPDDMVSVDAGGKFLLPGVIDAHVHFREPGLTAKADIATESRAAVAGGTTSYMEMPNTIPNATTIEILEDKFTLASQKSLANYSFFLGATNDNLDQILKADPARICGLKVFLGASTGNMLVDNEETLNQIFAQSPLLIGVHAENETIIRTNLAQARATYGDQIPVAEHPVIRNHEACFTSSAHAVELATRYESRLHLMHLSTARELSLLSNNQPLKDKKITGEVTVHHLWFDDRDYSDLGSLIRWNPAIKSPSDRELLMDGLNNDTIDIIATDHAPHLRSEKEKPYTGCPSGGPMIQHTLVAMMGFYHLGRITLEKIVEKLAHNPAVLYRVEKRGFIREGYFADLVLVDPDDPWVVESSNILYKCGWSPFEGVTFRSRVTHTWVNGHLVFELGRFDSAQNGHRLSFAH